MPPWSLPPWTPMWWHESSAPKTSFYEPGVGDVGPCVMSFWYLKDQNLHWKVHRTSTLRSFIKVFSWGFVLLIVGRYPHQSIYKSSISPLSPPTALSRQVLWCLNPTCSSGFTTWVLSISFPWPDGTHAFPCRHLRPGWGESVELVNQYELGGQFTQMLSRANITSNKM